MGIDYVLILHRRFRGHNMFNLDWEKSSARYIKYYSIQLLVINISYLARTSVVGKLFFFFMYCPRMHCSESTVLGTGFFEALSVLNIGWWLVSRNQKTRCRWTKPKQAPRANTYVTSLCFFDCEQESKSLNMIYHTHQLLFDLVQKNTWMLDWGCIYDNPRTDLES